MGELKNIVLGFLVLSIAVIGINSFWVDSATVFNANYTDVEYINVANETLTHVKDVQTNVEGITSEGIVGGIFSAGGALIATFKLLLGTVDIGGAFISNLGNVVGISTYVPYIIGILLIIVIFAILNALVKWDV